MQTNRIIGIRHRVKKTADGEARPTALHFLNPDGSEVTYDLEDDQAEFDWKNGEFPVHFRDVATDEDLTQFAPRHVKTRKFDKTENPDDFPQHLVVGTGKNRRLATKVPDRYDGLTVGDQVAMCMGGSGDRLAKAIASRAEQMGGGTAIFRTPPGDLKNHRPGDKDADAKNLVVLFRDRPSIFYKVDRADLALIGLTECYRARTDAMKARIGAEQRLRQQAIGVIFTQTGGDFEEGDLELQFDRAKASDTILQALVTEEDARIEEVRKAAEALDIFSQVLGQVEGVGPLTAARVLSPIVTIRRFWVLPDEQQIASLRQQARDLQQRGNFEVDRDKVEAETHAFQTLQRVRSWKQHNDKTEEADLLSKAIECYQTIAYLKHKALLKGAARFSAFCGVHVQKDGKLPRHRRGHDSKENNWSPDARQGLYLMGDQFNKRPGSLWGIRLRANKVRLRTRHPHPIKGRVWLQEVFRRVDAQLYGQGIHITDADINLQTPEDLLNMLFEKGVSDNVLRDIEKQLQETQRRLQGLTGAQRAVEEKTVQRWTDGHVHKTGIWRTLTQFAKWLFMQWTRLERSRMAAEVAAEQITRHGVADDVESGASAEVDESFDNANADVSSDPTTHSPAPLTLQ